MNDEADHRDGDTRVGYIERRPRTKHFRRVWAEIEKEEIDHVSVKETIGEISQNSGE